MLLVYILNILITKKFYIYHLTIYLYHSSRCTKHIVIYNQWKRITALLWWLIQRLWWLLYTWKKAAVVLDVIIARYNFYLGKLNGSCNDGTFVEARWDGRGLGCDDRGKKFQHVNGYCGTKEQKGIYVYTYIWSNVTHKTVSFLFF